MAFHAQRLTIGVLPGRLTLVSYSFLQVIYSAVEKLSLYHELLFLQ